MIIDVGNFSIHADSEMEQFRAQTFFEKEPETLSWIEDFDEDGIFIDVGANIGIYSLYAASLHPDILVIAIEPVLANYVRLIENIRLNNFSNIYPMHCSVGHGIGMLDLYLQSDEVGASGAQTGDPVDEHNNEFKPARIEPSIQINLDSLHELLQASQYIKIDVDGHENEIIRGAKKAFKESNSVLIECNRQQMELDKLTKFMNKCGLRPDDKYNNHPNHSRIRRGGNPENIVYAKI